MVRAPTARCSSPARSSSRSRRGWSCGRERCGCIGASRARPGGAPPFSSPGTLLFNASTFHALEAGLSTHEQNRLVWAPDLLGSACFLASGALAYGATTGPHLLPARWRPAESDPAWAMAAVNLLGCVLFGVSAIASYVVPSTGSVLALAPTNWGTALGALCFWVGSLLLWRRTKSHRAPDRVPPHG